MKWAGALLFFLFVGINKTQAQLSMRGVRQVDMLYAKRVERILSLLNLENNPLTSLYSNTDSNQHIAAILVKALMNNSIKAYISITDSFSYLSIAQLQQLLADTKEETDVDYTSTVISDIIIKEVWYLNRKLKRMERSVIALAPTIRNKKDSSIFYPLFWIKPNDFLSVCKQYHVITTDTTTNKMSLSEYIEQRNFSSRVLNVKEGNIEYIYSKERNAWIPPY